MRPRLAPKYELASSAGYCVRRSAAAAGRCAAAPAANPGSGLGPPRSPAAGDRAGAREARGRAAAGWWAWGPARDSATTAGVGADTLGPPGLDGVLLSPASAKRGSSFLLAGAGARFARPLAGAVSLQGGLRYQGRYQSNGFDRRFDQDALAGYGGISLLRGQDLYRASLSYAALALDAGRYRNISALGGEWQRQVDELNAYSLFAQYAALDYPASPSSDADLYALGAGWRRAFVQRYLPVVQLQALYGREKSSASPLRDDLSRDLYSLRAGVSSTPWPGWGISGGLTYTASRFAAPDPALAAIRRDDTTGLDAGLSYRWPRQPTPQADYLHADNRPNLEASNDGRDVLTLPMHYDIR